jgi:hypothetical protein
MAQIFTPRLYIPKRVLKYLAYDHHGLGSMIMFVSGALVKVIQSRRSWVGRVVHTLHFALKLPSAFVCRWVVSINVNVRSRL